MKIHEYQARQWLAQCQVPICRGEAVFDPKDAPDAFRRLANPQCMVKVQVLMGGRGKAGAKNSYLASDALAASLLATRLVCLLVVLSATFTTLIPRYLPQEAHMVCERSRAPQEAHLERFRARSAWWLLRFLV